MPANYLPVYREAWLHAGTAVDLGIIRMIGRDPNVTNIGPAGGTAVDSLGRIEVVVPAGALATTVPIQITSIAAREDMPARLSDSTPTLYGFELEPSGTTFSAPITVRLTNWRSAPTSIPIPTGVFDPVTGNWEHEAMATWSGGISRFTFTTSHFSTFDCNYTRPPNGPAPGPGPGPSPPPPCRDSCCAHGGDNGDGRGSDGLSGSSVSPMSGGLRQQFALPTYRVKNESVGLTLSYDSAVAGGRAVGAAPSNYQVVSHAPFAAPIRAVRVTAACTAPGSNPGGGIVNGQPGSCSATSLCTLGQATPIPLTASLSLLGATASRTFNLGSANAEVEYDSFVAIPQLGTTDSAARGIYPMRVELRAQTPGSCIAAGSTFGVSDGAAARTQTSLEDGPLATFDMMTFVNHRVTSPFGAGWTVDELSRVYRDGDLAYLASGSSIAEHFHPRAHARSLVTGVGRIIPSRDDRTGELFITLDNTSSIARFDPMTGTRTTVLSGLNFGAGIGAMGLAVGYVGTTRHFVIALTNRLLDVDASGTQRVIATRSGGASSTQPLVAARDNWVFYTDDINPVLYRSNLADTSPSLTALSASSGGDVRLAPHAALSGVSFASPRGVAIDSDGVVFLADMRKNAVYAIEPEAGGVVGPSSVVEHAMGEGGSGFLLPLGQRYPGTRFGLREPLGVNVAEDGSVLVLTTYGLAVYDKLAREAEWLFRSGGPNDELFTAPIPSYLGFVAVTPELVFANQSQTLLARFDIDRLSSEWDPTRTLRKNGGVLELTDTTRETIDRFDSAGRIIEHKKRTGETMWTAAYADATSDQVSTITDAVGGQTIFAYDGSGKIDRITDARGRVTDLTVNAIGDLVSMTTPASETWSFAYAEHRMTEKHSPRNDLTTYAFRADGTIQTATRPGGAVMTVDAAMSHVPTFDANNKVQRQGVLTDAHGVTHTQIINRRGDVEKDTYVADGVTRVEQATYATQLVDQNELHPSSPAFFADDASRRNNTLLRIAQRTVNGVIMDSEIVWDAHGRWIKKQEPLNSTTSQTRWFKLDGRLHADNNTENVFHRFERDTAGHVTRAFDSSNLTGTTGETGRQTLFSYRADGLVSTMTDHTIVRTFSYDDLGGTKNETGWTDTLGRSMTFTHDAKGNIASTSDGTATTFADYDPKNRVIATRDALGNETTYSYTDVGCNCSQDNLVHRIHTPDLPAGVNWEMEYDADGRLQSVTDPHAFTESYEYEPTGELKRVLDKLNRQTTWTHDQLGRVQTMTDTLSRRHDHAYTVPTSGVWTGPSLMAGSGDNTASSTTLSGTMRNGDYQIGKNVYQRYGYPARVSLYRDATFELGYTETYDAVKRLTRRDDRVGLAIDNTTTPTSTGAFQHEVFGWHPSTASPILRTVETTRPGGTDDTFYTRNIWFDVTSEDSLTNAAGTTNFETYTRDAGGRVTQIDRTYAGAIPTQTSTYTYRPDGRLERITNADGQHDFTYNSRGLVETQTVQGEGTYSYGYEAMGRNDYLEYPDGHIRRQVFDDLGRVTSRCYEYSGPVTRCYTAQYDAVGNPTRMTDPDGVDVLEYDGLDRLKKVTREEPAGNPVGVEDYDYNSLGALKVNAGVALDHQRPRLNGGGLADAAVPATVGGQAITLDAGGRITSLRGATFVWSGKGALLSATDGGVTETYFIDANERRFGKSANGVREYYLYEGFDRIATLNASGAVVESWLFDGIDHPLRIKQGATTAYYELDLAGNVRALRGPSGTDLGKLRYTAFGQTLVDTTTVTQSLRWKGRWHSSVAGGIYDVRARPWAPEIGIFTSVDGFGFHETQTTLWAWPNQNPCRYSDPYGTGKSECEKDEKRPRKCEVEKLKCQDACNEHYSVHVQANCLHPDLDPDVAERCEKEFRQISDWCLASCEQKSCTK